MFKVDGKICRHLCGAVIQLHRAYPHLDFPWNLTSRTRELIFIVIRNKQRYTNIKCSWLNKQPTKQTNKQTTTTKWSDKQNIPPMPGWLLKFKDTVCRSPQDLRIGNVINLFVSLIGIFYACVVSDCSRSAWSKGHLSCYLCMFTITYFEIDIKIKHFSAQTLSVKTNDWYCKLTYW